MRQRHRFVSHSPYYPVVRLNGPSAYIRTPLYNLGSLNHAHAKIAYPAWAARVAREKARVAREKARDNARAVAVSWDMHVFINQLIE